MSKQHESGVTPPEEAMEFSNVEKDTETLGNDVEILKSSEQPLPKKAETAYADLLAATDDAGKLDALKRMDMALEGYNPVKFELEAKDANSMIKRMILELEKTDA